MIRVAAYTPGRHTPSARFRVRQYLPFFKKAGIEVHEYVPREGTYPPSERLKRPLWAVKSILERIPAVVRSHEYDVTLLQREMFSSHITLEPFTKRPRILDVDDAIWDNRRGAFAESLARMCDAVICGNAFLAEQFRKWNSRVYIVPTAVDTKRFRPSLASKEKQIIGWSGSSSGFHYLYGIEKALATVLTKFPSVILRIIADAAPRFAQIPSERWEFVRWAPEIEVQAIQGMTIGIMPLDNSIKARGKCSFKMLCYMACGVPVVVSPVGMNVELLAKGDIGYAASSTEEWVDGIALLVEDPVTAKRKGQTGRRICIEHYDVHLVASRIAKIIDEVACG
ncbi:MAG: glycosyltransferase [Geobacter sp.]|nr:glycosyltransferase [Geobacter sp.]